MITFTDFSSASLLSIFLASLVGGAHCIGMCGGIVLLYSSTPGSAGGCGGAQQVKGHALYNFGRLNSYLLLGALAGMLGKSVNFASVAAGIGQVAGLVFGIVLLALGISILFQRRVPEVGVPGAGYISGIYRAIGADEGMAPPLRAYLLGLLSTLLPCGWLYMFAAVAASSGSILGGMVIMAVFWLGTVPYLLSVGFASQVLLGPLRKHLPVITGVLVIAAGLFSINTHYQAFSTVPLLEGKHVEMNHGHSHHHGEKKKEEKKEERLEDEHHHHHHHHH